ncbi:hypothetical protein [Ralstonia sp. A12]|uniref:hypothetical protein n=1 Tax=Ralstonia sp. A12 TaxID=1217052 RepID=UPI0012EED2CD|nr:hypothetical protein [Ralstonia sp. A12]
MKQRIMVTREHALRGIATLTSITQSGTLSRLPTHHLCRHGTRVNVLFGPT